MNNQNTDNKKSARAQREEEVLLFWKEKNIFQKTLDKEAPQGEFVFFEGPPTANAKPALHHLEARAFKDVIPRYKTMRGYHVARRAGWDTHGLPVELQIEKKLGLTSKKDIEEYGIAPFNKECKESVFQYIGDWEAFTDRIGYWVDKSSAYYTFNPSYMESLWSIVKTVHGKDLLYKDYKVVPWCPRCGTGLSSHELAQGYQDVKDLSVTAKFKIKPDQTISDSEFNEIFSKNLNEDEKFSEEDITELGKNAYLLAWTTTPWTLPGNVALAVGSDIEYRVFSFQSDHTDSNSVEEIFIFADALSDKIIPEIESKKSEFPRNRLNFTVKGSDLVGLSYEPLYPFLHDKLLSTNNPLLDNAFKVYSADFVTTTDGTGVVHTAVMYGADDFDLGTKVGLPKVHTVDETGHFIQGTGFLEGRLVKPAHTETGDEDVAIDIIKDLAHRGLLFKKEKYEHSYPHCWRCKTPLLYYARDSWYIRMSSLRDDLIRENEGINWEPSHIREGRFGEWLREVKDWAFSRERYWGTPLPIWQKPDGSVEVIGSVSELKSKAKKSGNKYFLMRHGETESNLKQVWQIDPSHDDVLSQGSEECIRTSAQTLKDNNIDMIVVSPFSRTQKTAHVVAEILGLSPESIVTDERLSEWTVGQEFDGKPLDDYFAVRNGTSDRYTFKTEGGESYKDVIIRSGECLYDIESKYKDKNILVISHGATLRSIFSVAEGYTFATLFDSTRDFVNFKNAEIRTLDFAPLPHNDQYELDLHRPYIDAVTLISDEGEEMTRVKEVIDVWFDSGAMPFAQDHYPFENKDWIEGSGYPADFISEAIDQTRGWFYTLLAVGVLMGKGTPYKNVVCLGHILDAEGKKMSKSVGNIVDPWVMMDAYGVDALRLWMYSVNQPGDSKNFDEKTVDELVKKVFNLVSNVYTFYELYAQDREEGIDPYTSPNVLDKWILSKLDSMIENGTKSFDDFDVFSSARLIREFADDLSTWYVRRSRDRFKGDDIEDKQYALATTHYVLISLSKYMAPFTPFFAEDLYQKVKIDTSKESVHLDSWPEPRVIDNDILASMDTVRALVTQGLEARQKSGIKVRQPLSSIKIKNWTLGSAYEDIIRDELNVKSVVNDDSIESVALDTDITPELKREGDFRELVRALQDLRKQSGLTPHDRINLTLSNSAQGMIEGFEEELKKIVQVDEIVFEDGGTSKIQIDGNEIYVSLG